MKKMFQISGTVLAAGVLFASMSVTAFAAQISEENAKSIALTNAGVSADTVSFIKAELDDDDGRLIYDVDFLTQNYVEYDFDIDAASGAVINIKYDWKAAPVSGTNAQATVTTEQAKTLAATHAGQTTGSVTFDKVKCEFDDGRLLYKIEFHTADQKEYDYEIDAVTGAIIEWEYDAKHYRPLPPAAAPTLNPAPSSGVTMESAKAAALKMAGLTSENVRWGKVKQDYEDGRLVYEGEFYYNNMEYEFEIDAATGAVTDWDVDEDD